MSWPAQRRRKRLTSLGGSAGRSWRNKKPGEILSDFPGSVSLVFAVGITTLPDLGFPLELGCVGPLVHQVGPGAEVFVGVVESVVVRSGFPHDDGSFSL